jgi:two-component system, sensor histidine kinase YesM
MRSPLSMLKHFVNLSIQRRLVISYFIIIFFPLTIVSVFAYNMAASSIKSEVSRYSSEVLQQVNDNIDNTVSELDRIASILASDRDIIEILQKDKKRSKVEMISDEEIMDEKINDIISLRSNIEGLFIFSYYGETYSYKGANNSIRLDYNFTRTRWFETMKSLEIKKLLLPTHLQNDVLTSGHKKNVFTLIREINNFDNSKPIGNILIDVDAEVFGKIWDKLNLRNYQDLIIVDNNKTVVYHTDEKLLSFQFRSNYISKILKSKKGSIITNINNDDALVTFNTSRFTNWTVISIIPLNILYENIINLQYIIFTAVAFFIIISFIVAILLSRSITRPISTLKHLMKRVESGKFDVSIPVKRTDEIGELSLSFNNMITRINNLIQTVYETRILKREAELNALQTQINPHFLYNTLQIIDIIAEDEGIDVICSVCRSLSRIFRYSISRGKETVPLSYELEHIKDYIYIHKLRFSDKFDVIYDIDNDIGNKQIIKLVLQPLVENAIFHGVENKKGKSTLTISAKMINENIELSVEDTGVGMDDYQLEKLRKTLNEEIIHADTGGLSKRSIGIKNVHARIRLYFGDAYGVTVESKPNIGTKIMVTIPSIDHEDGGNDENES